MKNVIDNYKHIPWGLPVKIYPGMCVQILEQNKLPFQWEWYKLDELMVERLNQQREGWPEFLRVPDVTTVHLIDESRPGGLPEVKKRVIAYPHDDKNLAPIISKLDYYEGKLCWWDDDDTIDSLESVKYWREL